jgi:hypothetical protein
MCGGPPHPAGTNGANGKSEPGYAATRGAGRSVFGERASPAGSPTRALLTVRPVGPS